MNRDSGRITVAVRRSLGCFWAMIGLVGLLVVGFMVPSILVVTEVLGRARTEWFKEVLNNLSPGPWIALVMFGLVAAFVVVFIRYVAPRRTELLCSGDRVVIDGREYNLPDRPARPGKWTHPYAGTLGTAFVLHDPEGRPRHLGIQDVLLDEDHYGPLAVEECDFYIETAEEGGLFIDRMRKTGAVDLPEDSPGKRGPFGRPAVGERLSLALTPSFSGVRTWLPLCIGFPVAIYAVVGLVMGLRKYLGASDAVAYVVTLVGILVIIAASVVYGTRRLRNMNLRLEIDSEHLTIQKGSGKVVARRRIGELTFGTLAWTSHARQAGHFYVGPQLEILSGPKSVFRVGTMKPEYRWASPSRNVTTCDYVLGPPEWLKVVEFLGLSGRLERAAE